MERMVYEIDHVSQIYKKGKIRANDDITFHIPEGEILGILGPNGAGKSTLIKQLVGHLQPTEGRVLFDGMEVLRQTKRVASLVAYFSQEPQVLSSLMVHEALSFTGRLRGIPKKEAEKQTSELLEQFDLGGVRSKLLKHLSGGQKRMVGIGTALIGYSPVLILDEPTNELDPRNRRLIWELVKERNRQGTTVILVTHNVLEAEQVVDRVAVINHGKLLAIDSVSKLKQKVDQRLKFEVTTEFARREEAEAALKRWGAVQVNGENRLQLLVETRVASRLLDYIVGHPELPIEEYSIRPPSLEDVYFHIDEQSQKEVVEV